MNILHDPNKLTLIKIRDSDGNRYAWRSDDPGWKDVSETQDGLIARFRTRERAEKWKMEQKRRLKVIDERKCDACMACCTVLGVTFSDGDEKAPGTPCSYLNHGCGIYEARPKMCMEYLCGWRRGVGRPGDRPDLVGIVLSAYDNKPEVTQLIDTSVTFVAHETRLGSFDEQSGIRLLEHVASRFLVIGVRYPSYDKLRVLGAEDHLSMIDTWLRMNRFTRIFDILDIDLDFSPTTGPGAQV